MKKIEKSKKLGLNKESVRNLSDLSLQNAAGGFVSTNWRFCTQQVSTNFPKGNLC